jgi:hypothetical protein
MASTQSAEPSASGMGTAGPVGLTKAARPAQAGNQTTSSRTIDKADVAPGARRELGATRTSVRSGTGGPRAGVVALPANLRGVYAATVAVERSAEGRLGLAIAFELDVQIPEMILNDR